MENNINKKEKIINAAIKLFAKNGYAGTSIRDIAKLANSSISMVSYHFGGKEGLYRSILKDLFDKQQNVINSFYDKSEFLKFSKKEKADFLLKITEKMVDFFYNVMNDELFAFLLREQRHIVSEYTPPVVVLLREIIAQIIDKPMLSREVVYASISIASQISASRFMSVFVAPYAQDGFEVEDINMIKQNVKNSVLAVVKSAGINL
ncbi:MAG: CerR family C-terminal domain-containing protein [Candidatus Gastranaerophilales bacterium]|nr:CerR family C-terminal domain-containing protein [Candidatus Gastranaerophilales bacterium]